MIRYELNPQIAWREVDGEAVLIDPTSGQLLVLNRTGSRLWRAIGSGADLDGLKSILTDEFAPPPAAVEEDVRGFLRALSDRDLVTATDASEERRSP